MSAEAWHVAPVEQSPRHHRNRKVVGAWLFTICGLIALMVLVGGLTRLTHSGLSITEWRPVTGVIPPLSEAAWQAEFAKYQRIPEYIELNSGMSLGEFKDIYWWEWTHRLLGRIIGLVFLVPFLVFLARRWVDRPLAARLAVIFLLGGAQGAVGWYMVSSGLVHRTDVSQLRLTAHLGFAFAIYAVVLWTALDIATPARRRARSDLNPLRGAMLVLVALIFLQVLLGALVAGLDAGLIYNTWPLMDGHFIPGDLSPLRPWWVNTFETVKTVQFDHRMLAYIVSLLMAGTWLWGRRHALPTRARRWLDACAIAVAAQVTLGILTLVHVVPLPLAAAHQMGALALFTCALVAFHAVLRATQRGPVLAVVA